MQTNTIDMHLDLTKETILKLMHTGSSQTGPKEVIDSQINYLKSEIKRMRPYIQAFIVDCDPEFDENDEIHITVKGILPEKE